MRRFWNLSWWWKGPIIATAALILLVIVIPSPEEEDDPTVAAETAAPTTAPTTVITATPTAEPTAVTTAPAEPVVFTGTGPSDTASFTMTAERWEVCFEMTEYATLSDGTPIGIIYVDVERDDGKRVSGGTLSGDAEREDTRSGCTTVRSGPGSYYFSVNAGVGVGWKVEAR